MIFEGNFYSVGTYTMTLNLYAKHDLAEVKGTKVFYLIINECQLEVTSIQLVTSYTERILWDSSVVINIEASSVAYCQFSLTYTCDL